MMPNFFPGNSSDEYRCLIQIFNCYLCHQTVQKPQNCPNCSKFYCQTCIMEYLLTDDSKCPYCSFNLQKSSLVNCQAMYLELSEEQNFKQIAKTVKNSDQRKKKLDTEANFDSYIRKMITNLSDYKLTLINYTQFLGKNPYQRQFNIVKQQKYVYQRMDKFKNRIINRSTRITEIKKNFALKMQKNIDYCNNVYANCFQKLKNCKKANLMGITGHEIQINVSRAIKSQINIQKQLLFEKKYDSQQRYTLRPNYNVKIFIFHKCTMLNTNDHTFFSDKFQCSGLQWRVKIFKHSDTFASDGKQNSQLHPNKSKSIRKYHQYLAIYIEMSKSLRPVGKYMHQLTIIHPRDSEKNLVRQYESQFGCNYCWGYNEFVKFNTLENQNYFNNESLQIRLQITPSTYYQALMDAQVLKKQKEAQSLRNKKFIGMLRKKLKISQDIPQKEEINPQSITS